MISISSNASRPRLLYVQLYVSQKNKFYNQIHYGITPSKLMHMIPNSRIYKELYIYKLGRSPQPISGHFYLTSNFISSTKSSSKLTKINHEIRTLINHTLSVSNDKKHECTQWTSPPKLKRCWHVILHYKA